MSWSQINFTQLELHFLVESLTKYTTRKVQGSRGKKLSSFVYSELFCLTVGEYLKTFKPVKKNIAKKTPWQGRIVWKLRFAATNRWFEMVS